MCLYSSNKQSMTVPVGKGITCYKVLERVTTNYKPNYWTPYYRIRCKLGQTITPEKKARNTPDAICRDEVLGIYEVKDGYIHSFSSYIDALSEAEHLNRYCSYNIDANYVVVRATIPAGAEYYQGQNGFSPISKMCYASTILKLDDKEYNE